MKPEDLWIIFGAVLGANLLTVMFVWACLNISRREQRQESLGLYLGAAITPLAFFVVTIYGLFFEG